MDVKDLIVQEIEIFLVKYGNNRNKVSVDFDYEFIVDKFEKAKVNVDSINESFENSFHFNGEAVIERHDIASKFHTTVPVQINGVAFYAEDKQGDNLLIKISIILINDNLKNNNHETV